MFSKNENNVVFENKASKLHKNDTILHVLMTFFLKRAKKGK